MHSTDIVPEHIDVIDTWQALSTPSDVLDDSMGPYFYLTEDIELAIRAVTRDTYICLNGHKLTYAEDIYQPTSHVYICNCKDYAEIDDADYSITTSTQIYGNITYSYGKHIVDIIPSSSNQNVYFYGVNFERTGSEEEEDFVIDSSDSCKITLEKVTMLNCTKTSNLYTAGSTNGVFNIIDSTFDYGGNVVSYATASQVRGFFHAPYQSSYAGNTINFKGNNVFKNLVLENLSLFNTQKVGPLPTDAGILGVNGFDINVLDGNTTFSNIELIGDYAKNFIDNNGGGKLTVSESATLELNGIDLTNDTFEDQDRFLLYLDNNDEINGNLIIAGCKNNGDYGRIIDLKSSETSLPGYFNIGDGKLYIADNEDGTSDSNVAGIFAEVPVATDSSILNVASGRTINIETYIEGVAMRYVATSSEYRTGNVISSWSLVSGGRTCQDVFTAYDWPDDDRNFGVILDGETVKLKEVTTYKVEFRNRYKATDSSMPKSMTINENCKIPKVATPSVGAYETFLGWYTDLTDDTTKWDFDTDRVTEDIILYEKVQSTLKYRLAFDPNGGEGSMPTLDNMPVGDYISLATNSYTKEGYIFVGWCEDSAHATPDLWETVDHWHDKATDFIYWTDAADTTKTIYAVWVINHMHKICGVTGDCTHYIEGNNHTSAVNYAPLVDTADLNDTTKSAYLYLNSDITITSELTRTIYLCLNGHTLNTDVSLSNIYICNCGVNSNIVAKSYVIEGDAEVYGQNKNISFIASHSFVRLTTDDVDSVFLSDVKLSGELTDGVHVNDIVHASSSVVYFNDVNIDDVTVYRSIFRNGGNATIKFIDNTFDSINTPDRSLFSSVGVATVGNVHFIDDNILRNINLRGTPSVPIYDDADKWSLYMIGGTTTFDDIGFADTALGYIFPKHVKLGDASTLVNKPATLSIINCKIFRHEMDESIIDLNDFDGNVFEIYGNLIIKNNKYVNCNTQASVLSIINTRDKQIRLGSNSYIIISGNKPYSDQEGIIAQTDINGQHIYSLYSTIADNVTPIFMMANGATFDTNMYIDGVAFSTSSNHKGHIINNNTNRKCFVADTYNPSDPTTALDLESGLSDDGLHVVVDEPKVYYSIKYNANGGSGTMADRMDILTGLTITLDANAYTKTGYRFVGWATNSSATTATWVDSDTTFSHNATQGEEYNLYAVWKVNKYKVRYNKNEGGGVIATGSTPSEMTGYSTINLTLADNTGGDQGSLTSTGYYLVGWNENEHGTGAEYTLGGTMNKIIDAADDGMTIDLYAMWSDKVPYVIVLDNNGG
ncbi:MAG: InlB B-repeat-containing protein, partial [Lachnospiraceae bacterium]|nr:InlB B-repeat-containing protein [Lachnospiraceae bacterium]